MLVLSRKKCESIVIWDTDGSRRVLKLTVLQIRGRRVRLGFEAGPELRIQREELGTSAEFATTPAKHFAPAPGLTTYRVRR